MPAGRERNRARKGESTGDLIPTHARLPAHHTTTPESKKNMWKTWITTALKSWPRGRKEKTSKKTRVCTPELIPTRALMLVCGDIDILAVGWGGGINKQGKKRRVRHGKA